MLSIVKRSIDADTARRAIEAAARKAEEIGLKISVSITDESGQLKSFLRMDGAALLTVQIAQDKAWTAASYGIATHVWHEFIKNDPPLLHGITHTPRLVIFGGGYPIKEEGQMIGAIGISGGHYSQDMECCKAALAAIGSPSE
jgi:uncharacterized protein GlcG (DUF336 family)